MRIMRSCQGELKPLIELMFRTFTTMRLFWVSAFQMTSGALSAEECSIRKRCLSSNSTRSPQPGSGNSDARLSADWLQMKTDIATTNDLPSSLAVSVQPLPRSRASSVEFAIDPKRCLALQNKRFSESCLAGIIHPRGIKEGAQQIETPFRSQNPPLT